jgi:hypothetical protein
MRTKLPGSQTHDCGIDSDDIHYIRCLGPEMDKSSEEILERLLVLLLTREKITLCKLWTLETLEVRKDPLFQVFPAISHSRAQERIPLRRSLVSSDDERLCKH